MGILPVPKTIALGGVATGSINAQLALIAAGQRGTINRAGSSLAANATTVGNPQ